MNIKTRKRGKPVIVLDAGGVLVNFNLNLLFRELSERFGRDIGPALQLDLDALFFPLQVGAQSWEDIPPILNSALDLSLDPEEWRELWCHIFTDEVEGMRAALAELKAEYRLVALSNTTEAHWTYLLQKYPIFKLLDGWVVSYIEGVTKPHPAIYQAVMDGYCDGRLPLFYTDDTTEYVEAARSLGWEAELFSSAERLKGEIKKRRMAHVNNPR